MELIGLLKMNDLEIRLENAFFAFMARSFRNASSRADQLILEGTKLFVDLREDGSFFVTVFPDSEFCLEISPLGDFDDEQEAEALMRQRFEDLISSL